MIAPPFITFIISLYWEISINECYEWLINEWFKSWQEYRSHNLYICLWLLLCYLLIQLVLICTIKNDFFPFSLAPELSSRETASGCRTSGSQATPTTCESGTTETVTAVVTSSAEAPIPTATNMLLLQQPQVGINYKVLLVFFVVQQVMYFLRAQNLNFTIFFSFLLNICSCHGYIA